LDVFEEVEVESFWAMMFLFLFALFRSQGRIFGRGGTSSGGLIGCMPPPENGRFVLKGLCLAMNEEMAKHMRRIQEL
jgi:hypothetical protein